MAIVLNGTSGITNDSGYTGDGVSFADSTPANTLVTTSGGNVGMGTSSPSAAKLVVRSGTGTAHTVLGNDYGSLYLETASGGPNRITSLNSALNASQALAFNGAGGAEWGRFDSSGNLLVGTTSALNSTHTFVSSSNGTISLRCSGATAGNFYRVGHDSASAFIIYNQSNIGVYLNPNATSWSANSDERVKDIIEPITNAAEKVASLRAVIGKYKNDSEGSRRAFLIAQDVQAVLPEAVNQQNDEIGTLGVQYTDVIPLLVAAIKELKAEVDSLKAQINGATE